MTTSELEPQKTAKPKTVAIKPTRQAQLHKLLTRKSGVTIAQLQKTFGWQPHTARAAISAQRKAGCAVTRTETDKGSVYRIVAGQGDQ
ncbi:DUF3489 domain-containing protein [Marimonas sp. MJW-29]|uniref:DUF3489 domain-containing protein n=1 Tax=Sulfitobacter sediminis TaxID=3234186 RepID=A0ABV3RU00_9RHOB